MDEAETNKQGQNKYPSNYHCPPTSSVRALAEAHQLSSRNRPTCNSDVLQDHDVTQSDNSQASVHAQLRDNPQPHDSRHSHNHVHTHSHNHNRPHAHAHTHTHSHRTPGSSSRLVAAIAITLTIMAAQLVGAKIANSLSLAADAGHMLVDSSGLIIALIATRLMKRPRSDRHTWGYSRAEVLAAAIQSGMLIVISLTVIGEALTRLWNPYSLNPKPMLIIATIGLVGNILSLLVILDTRQTSINMKAAFLEVANDALGSIAVVIASLVALATNWDQADALASLAIVAMMIPRAYKLLKHSVSILMEETPANLDIQDLKKHFLALDNVENVHDLHISTIQTGLVTISAHVAVQPGISEKTRNEILHSLEECTASHFPVAINHTTFQLDTRAHSDHENLSH